MELLIYTKGQFEGVLDQLNSTMKEIGGRVQHSNGKFNTIVVEFPDEAYPQFEAARKNIIALAYFIDGVEELQYQVRFNLSDAFAAAAKYDQADPSFEPLHDLLKKYNAVIKNQYEAFADFCKDAEARGETDTTLYKWTKATIEKPGKKEQYSTRFTVYASGGLEVYDKAVADGLEADLETLVKTGMIARVNKFNTDPAQNPQAGPQFR